MSESAIADFVAQFNSSAIERRDPTKGRILLSKKRLVLATNNDNKITIPLTQIFDVAVGQVPPDLGDFFDSTVTIAFNSDEMRHVAAIEANDDKIQKFSTVLFKALLNGTTMTVKHPARIGGRVSGEQFYPAKLFLKPQSVEFKGNDESFRIALSTVTNFDRKKREIAGATREVLAVRHMQNGQAATSLAATESSRKMGILGRYLRLEYSDIVDELQNIDLSDEETELLVAVYSTGPGVSLASVVDTDPSRVTMMLNDLEQKDLIAQAGDDTELTGMGQIVVSDKLEDVNT